MNLCRYAVVPVAFALALSIFGCSGKGVTDSRSGKPVDLKAVEIREYQGKDLSSVSDFRENSIKGPQKVDLDSYSLKISGEVSAPVALSYEDVTQHRSYKKVVTLNCVEGWSVDILWEGVLITDLLDEAGYDSAAPTVIFHCADGYTTSLPLQFIEERKILLAYRMNGIELPEERGFPFQVVAEDKWGYKWAKWVTRIEVSENASYRGYWERRGYENDATIPDVR